MCPVLLFSALSLQLISHLQHLASHNVLLFFRGIINKMHLIQTKEWMHFQVTEKVENDMSWWARQCPGPMHRCTAGVPTQTWSASGTQRRTRQSRRQLMNWMSGSAYSNMENTGRTGATPPSDFGVPISVFSSLKTALWWLAKLLEDGANDHVMSCIRFSVPVSNRWVFWSCISRMLLEKKNTLNWNIWIIFLYCLIWLSPDELRST